MKSSTGPLLNRSSESNFKIKLCIVSRFKVHLDVVESETELGKMRKRSKGRSGHLDGQRSRFRLILIGLVLLGISSWVC